MSELTWIRKNIYFSKGSDWSAQINQQLFGGYRWFAQSQAGQTKKTLGHGVTATIGEAKREVAKAVAEFEEQK